MDAVACNASDTLQRWLFDGAIGLLFTRASPAAVLALAAPTYPCKVDQPPYVDTGSCAADISNHQSTPGTVISCSAAISAGTPRWELLKDPSGGAGMQLRSISANYSDRCMWHTPLPPPPPPPPPSPPKPACVAPGCVVLSNAAVEILRLNAPWAPSAPTCPVGGCPASDDYWAQDNRSPLPAGYGLLFPQLTQGHGTTAVWGLDPTYDPAYGGNDGTRQPQFTAAYDPEPLKYGGPAARLRAPGSANPDPADPYRGSFDSFKVLTLFGDSEESERQGLGVRKLTRLLAPQTSETPQFMHLTNVTAAGVRNAVDQIVATGGGIDMIIFSFGSGFDIESDNHTYWAEVKASVSYANANGVEVGGYDLIALSRTGSIYFDVIDPLTNQSLVPGSTCFASGWNRGLLAKVLHFMDVTGLSMIETDGPFGGTPCGATDHDHYGADDSVQRQWENQVAFYEAMRARGAFVHAPDNYVFAGGANKDCGWYSEMQYSLPRWQHMAVSHQEVYDYTFLRTPTQDWMFAPLVEYHGGGAAAALEPFSQTGRAWETTLTNYLGAGVGACYRGDRLFDTPAVKAMVSKWMAFWVKYRRVLVQDLVHVKRPDMQSVDCLLHASANKSEHVAALAMLYNPTLRKQSASLDLPLYYTGEGAAVEVAHEEGAFHHHKLARDYSVRVTAELAPQSATYFVVRRVRLNNATSQQYR